MQMSRCIANVLSISSIRSSLNLLHRSATLGRSLSLTYLHISRGNIGGFPFVSLDRLCVAARLRISSSGGSCHERMISYALLDGSPSSTTSSPSLTSPGDVLPVSFKRLRCLSSFMVSARFSLLFFSSSFCLYDRGLWSFACSFWMSSLIFAAARSAVLYISLSYLAWTFLWSSMPAARSMVNRLAWCFINSSICASIAPVARSR